MQVHKSRQTRQFFRSGRGPRRRRCFHALDGLERRELLATISVNASQVVRSVDTQLLGVNVAWYDSVLNTPQTAQMVEAAGLTMFRFPGGSSSDDFHFNQAPAYNGEGTDGSMASFVSSVNGVGLATIDYGSGSPQEAAAFLAYLEAPVGNNTVIGSGQEWNDSTNINPLSNIGEYIGFNLDIGHYVAGTKGKSPIPVIEKYHDKIISLHLKDRTPQGGNLPWGKGQTPIKEVLQLLKKEQWPIFADIELEYPIPAGSDAVKEVAKCVEYCKEALA